MMVKNWSIMMLLIGVQLLGASVSGAETESPRQGNVCFGAVPPDQNICGATSASKQAGKYFSLVRITHGEERPGYTVRLLVYPNAEAIDIVSLANQAAPLKLEHIALKNLDLTLASEIFGHSRDMGRNRTFHLRNAFSCLAEDFYFDLRFDSSGHLDSYRIRSDEIENPRWSTVKNGTTSERGWYLPIAHQ